ncbi:transcription antitermination factor NusB [Pseudonocardiaceae bacterium YIM PH 21723]|nr:transcription antitermination factor NusB [Pseudonocardiaceae bacterium YIM PH 21723]
MSGQFKGRSGSRKRAVEILFEADIRGLGPVSVLADRVGSTDTLPVNDYTVTLVEGVNERMDRLDDVLMQHVTESWSLNRLPAVDRAVLRVGLYEILFAADVPDAVAIDEAVELAKALSTDDSPRFINGVLGRIVQNADRFRTAPQ